MFLNRGLLAAVGVLEGSSYNYALPLGSSAEKRRSICVVVV